MTTQSDQWRRVGAWLIQRRTELGYKQRTAWAREKSRPRWGMRVIVDMETGERDTYGDDAVQAAEDAYRLQPGSLRRALSGEIPTPQPADSSSDETPRTVVEDHVLETSIGHVTYQIVRDPTADDTMSPEERRALEEALAERLRTEIPLFVEMRRREIEEQRTQRDA